MNLLITGIAGFIGSKIAREALIQGYTVFGVDDLSQGKIENVPKKANFLKLDLSQSTNFLKLPKNIDVILHLAGQSSGEISFDDPIADLSKNTISTLNLIQYGTSHKVQKLIYASSMSVYGNTPDIAVSEKQICNPLSCYGVGKLAAENYLKVYQQQLPFTIFRMFNVYGPGQDLANLRQGMVSIFLSYVLQNNYIPVKGSINRFRDFIYIDDVVKVWLESIKNPLFINKIFNLGTGVKKTVGDVLDCIKVFFPHMCYSENPSTPGDQFGIYANISELKKVIETIHFTSFEHGMNEFVQWAKHKKCIKLCK